MISCGKYFYISKRKKQCLNRIFKLTQTHASVIYQIPWIHWISVPFKKNSNTIHCTKIKSPHITQFRNMFPINMPYWYSARNLVTSKPTKSYVASFHWNPGAEGYWFHRSSMKIEIFCWKPAVNTVWGLGLIFEKPWVCLLQHPLSIVKSKCSDSF